MGRIAGQSRACLADEMGGQEIQRSNGDLQQRGGGENGAMYVFLPSSHNRINYGSDLKSAPSFQPIAESSKAAREREAKSTARTSSTSTSHLQTKPSSSRRLSISKTNGKSPHV